MSATEKLKTRNDMTFLPGLHDRAIPILRRMTTAERSVAIPGLVEECFQLRELVAVLLPLIEPGDRVRASGRHKEPPAQAGEASISTSFFEPIQRS